MKRVGLALGSGGARGWAHIGVLKALQEEGIEINMISGSSIGALVGAFHCAGELNDLEDLIRDLDWKDVLAYFDMVLPTSGLLDGNKIYELLSEHLHEMRIENSEVPFCCVATDLLKSEEVHLRSGSMVDAVRASISVPGIFTPFGDGDRFLVDGGLVNPIPVDVARSLGAELVIAVNLNCPDHGADVEPNGDPSGVNGPEQALAGPAPSSTSEASKRRIKSSQGSAERWFPDGDPSPNIFDVIGLSLNVMEQQVTHSRLNEHAPDLLIQPALAEFAIFDFHKADAIIGKGYTAMKRQLPALKELL
ncbi:patatin family protein [Cyanobium sp. LEGE 06113]|nr:patatin family protein [Cyanobium sp. LEGE 06113]MBE9153998.1 patatin family protein [Cyanobium sp. LEGE 06113]